jgi:tartrate dehydrogenase/decarboxylase/D-malate dehydrogenase
MMPEDGLDRLRDCDAIYLGAIGFPGVPDHVSLWELLLPIRQRFDQYVNLRPVAVLEGIPGPLRDRGPDDVDILCIRENTEGEYVGIGGRLYTGTPEETAVQTSVFTRRGIERVARYAFERARERRRATRERHEVERAAVHRGALGRGRGRGRTRLSGRGADAVSRRRAGGPVHHRAGHPRRGRREQPLRGRPHGYRWRAPGVTGLAASGNIDPERRYPSMFEPVHGSAPTIAGQGIANPMAAVWSASMMLEHLGEREAAALLMSAIRAVARRVRGHGISVGTASTDEVGAAIVAAIGQGG